MSNNEIDAIIWHARLGQIWQKRMHRLAREIIFGLLTKVELPICENYSAKELEQKKSLQLIHSDICGLINIRVKHGASYFITFIDDYSCFSYFYLISHKSKVLDCFRLYINMVKNQLDSNAKVLRTDRECQYLLE